MDARGFVQVERDLVDSPIWGDDFLVRLYLWCKFKANFRPGNHLGQVIEIDQFVMGRHMAAESLGVAPSRLWRGLAKLGEAKLIVAKSNSKWTTVTVLAPTTYEDSACADRTAFEQHLDSKRTANGQHLDTIEECNNAITEERKNGRQKEIPFVAIATGDDAKPKPLPPKARDIASRKSYHPDFEAWWAVMPFCRNGRKRYKDQAFSYWSHIGSKDYPDLMTAAKHYAECDTVLRGYTKSPRDWLLEWRDWIEPPQIVMRPMNGQEQKLSPGEKTFLNCMEILDGDQGSNNAGDGGAGGRIFKRVFNHTA